jgi:hypothetical protein
LPGPLHAALAEEIMKEFRIKSSDSDLELVLSDIQGDYFKARLSSDHINSVREVYAYTDAYGVADMMESLSSQEKGWSDIRRWETIEGEFKVATKCSKLGQVTFEIELSHYGCSEEWLVKTQLKTELGQMPRLAKSARAFFGKSPS